MIRSDELHELLVELTALLGLAVGAAHALAELARFARSMRQRRSAKRRSA